MPESSYLGMLIRMWTIKRGLTFRATLYVLQLYQFTVEFGMCKQDGQLRAYGAGLLSSYGELKHAFLNRPQLLPFDPATTALLKHDDQNLQKLYFVCESLEDMKDKMRWCLESRNCLYQLMIHSPAVGYAPTLWVKKHATVAFVSAIKI